MQLLNFNRKRLLGLVLTLCMIATMLPLTALAADEPVFTVQPVFVNNGNGTGTITWQLDNCPYAVNGLLYSVEDPYSWIDGVSGNPGSFTLYPDNYAPYPNPYPNGEYFLRFTYGTTTPYSSVYSERFIIDWDSGGGDPVIPINISEVQGIGIPEPGGIPTTEIDAEQFSGSVYWRGSMTPEGTFVYGREYSVDILIMPKAGYTLTGIPENFFNVTGAVSTEYKSGSGVISAVFPRLPYEINFEVFRVGGDSYTEYIDLVIAPFTGIIAPDDAFTVVSDTGEVNVSHFERIDEYITPTIINTVWRIHLDSVIKSGIVYVGVNDFVLDSGVHIVNTSPQPVMVYKQLVSYFNFSVSGNLDWLTGLRVEIDGIQYELTLMPGEGGAILLYFDKLTGLPMGIAKHGSIIIELYDNFFEYLDEINADEFKLTLTLKENENAEPYDLPPVTVKVSNGIPYIPAIVLESIEITPPVKLEYLVGEKLDLTGIVVTAKYSDGTTKAITGYTTNPESGAALNSDGTITIYVSYTEGGIPVGGSYTVTVSKSPILVPIVVSTMPSAYVTKQSGNKNDLTITVTEILSDGSKNNVIKTFSINNNVAGTYQVGAYKVYVDTKGNTQIRECYIVKTE